MEATIERTRLMFQKMGLGVLGVFVFLLAPPSPTLGDDQTAAKDSLEVLELLDKSLFQTAVVEISATTGALANPCSNARLSLVDSNSSELIKVEPGFRDCSEKEGVLRATASMPRKAIAGREVDIKLEVCSQSNDCSSYIGRLPDSAQPLELSPILFKGIRESKLFFETSANPDEINLDGRVRIVHWFPFSTLPLADPEIGPGDKKNSVSIRVPVGCSGTESVGTESTQVVFTVQTREGRPEGFVYEGALPLCPPSREWDLWIGGGIGLILLALTGLFVASPRTRARFGRLFRNRADLVSPPSWFDARIQALTTKVDDEFRDIKERLGQLRPGNRLPPSNVDSQRSASEQRPLGHFDEDDSYSPERGVPDSSLLQVVNDWWSEASGDKEVLIRRISEHGLKLYESLDTDSTLQNMVGRTYSFQPSSGPAGWVWQPLAKGEAFAVPADPFLFHAGNMIEIIKLLFDGIGDAPKNFRFHRALRPCRLRADSVGSNRYRLVEKGFLELADRVGSRIPGPSSPASQSSPRTPVPSPPPSPRRLDDATFSSILEKKIDELRHATAELGKGLKDIQAQRREPGNREVVLPPELLRSQRRLEELPEILKKLDGIQSALSELVLRVNRLEDCPPQMSPVPLVESETVRSSENSLSAIPGTPQESLVMLGLEDEDSPARVNVPWESVSSRWMPESSAPVLRSEPEALTKQASPDEFLRQLLWGLPGLATVGSEPPGQPIPADYLKRLVALKGRLIHGQSEKPWEVALVHLQLARPGGQQPFFAIHSIDGIRDDYREALCRKCGAISEYYLYQVFLLLREEEGDRDVGGVVMVHSKLADQFADGYSLLTRQGAPRIDGSVGMAKPAVLQRVAGSSEAWRVALPMEVVLQ